VHHREHLGHETLAYVETGARAVPLNLNRPAGGDPKVNHHAASNRLGRLARATLGRFRQHEKVDEEREDLFARGDDGGHRYKPAELVVRANVGVGVRPGEAVTVAVDTSHMYIFDRSGHRIAPHVQVQAGQVSLQQR
jgi:hypothetical protein